MKQFRNTQQSIEFRKIEYELTGITKNNEEIAILSVRGIWPNSSNGNNDAAILSNKVVEIVKDKVVSKVIIDLSKLEYRFGNSILSFTIPAFKQNNKFEYSIIATEETERCLISLYEYSNLKLGLKGIFNDRESCIAAM